MKKTPQNKMKKYTTILFDVDGTIIDTDELILKTFHQLYDKYLQAKRRSDEEIFYFSGPPIRDTLQIEFPFVPIDKIYQEFHDLSWNNYPNSLREFPHVKEILLQLKDRGYNLGVITNKLHKTTDYCIELLKMKDIFSLIIGSDDVKKGKPDPEGVNFAIEKFYNVNKSEVLYVGDNASDLQTADNAGIDCALLYWGPRKLPKELNPKYKLKNFTDLREILL